MSKVTLTAQGLEPLHARIRRALTGVPRAVRETNQSWVPRLREMLVQHSSGRPGPESVTGAYNAAYQVQLADDGMAVTADNPSPQSDRLEYGFVGADALGRHYHQPAFPHFRPTMDEAGPLYTEDIKNCFWRFWL